MDDETQFRRAGLVDYMVTANDMLNELFASTSFPDEWSIDELKQVAEASDSLITACKLAEHRRADRLFLSASGIDPEKPQQ